MIKHLACIMDGNRRWAQQRSLMPWYGHSQGAEAIKTVMRFCLENGIRYLSLYAFSIENLKRSAIEKEYIFSYIVSEAHKQLPDFLERGIKIRFLGDTSLFPAAVLSTCRMLEQATEQGTSLYVQVLFCYGARQELLSATKEIVRSIALGELTVDDITQETLEKYLWTAAVPEPDLVIRTGGFKRLSNFLLYQAAYSELYFTDRLWPEITMQDLNAALDAYQASQRKFGV